MPSPRGSIRANFASNVGEMAFGLGHLDLHRAAMALRLRRAGRQWLQTLKGAGSVVAGMHSRNEWETVLAHGELLAHGESLDFKALEACGGKLPRGVSKKELRPVFVTDFSRTRRMVAFEGAEIELCLDSGCIRAGEKIRPISELELELKSGRPLQLFRLALALLDIVPLEIEPVNKAEYGYLLLATGLPDIAKAQPPALTNAMDIPAALQGMAGSCLLHLLANIHGAAHEPDEKYLHQVRVALRRLRVALGMAGAFCGEDDELSALRQEVTALCVELGRSVNGTCSSPRPWPR